MDEGVNRPPRLANYNGVTLRGIVGVGKTFIALHFAYQSLSDYGAIVDEVRADNRAGSELSGGPSSSGRDHWRENQAFESRQIYRDFLSQAYIMSLTS